MILYEPDNSWSVLISPVLQMGKSISEIWGSLFKVMQKARGKAGICSGQHGTRFHFLNHYTRLPPVWLLFLQVFAFLLQNTSIFPICSPFFLIGKESSRIMVFVQTTILLSPFLVMGYISMIIIYFFMNYIYIVAALIGGHSSTLWLLEDFPLAFWFILFSTCPRYPSYLDLPKTFHLTFRT